MMEPTTTSQILGALFIAGLFFTIGFASAVADMRKAERKRKQQAKVAEMWEILEMEIEEHDQNVLNARDQYIADMRKQAVSDNDWSVI